MSNKSSSMRVSTENKKALAEKYPHLSHDKALEMILVKESKEYGELNSFAKQVVDIFTELPNITLSTEQIMKDAQTLHMATTEGKRSMGLQFMMIEIMVNTMKLNELRDAKKKKSTGRVVSKTMQNAKRGN